MSAVTLLSLQVLLNIVNFSKTKSLYREGLAPVVCSKRRPQWDRIPSSQVLYYRSPKGPGERMAYVMSFLFQFHGATDAPYYFAYSFPYTYTDLQRYLYSVERQGLPFLRREVLCRTLQERRVELLTITAPEGEAGARPLRERKLVFLSARVHPGETPAQFIIHGVIDFLTGQSPRARALRGNVVFKIAPMLNPDGVVNGNYRCSYLGFDLNRHWLTPSAWAQPEILSVKSLVTELHRDPSADLDFFVDIHAHSVGTNSFMFGNNIPKKQSGQARQARQQEPVATGASAPTSGSTLTLSSPRTGKEPNPVTPSRLQLQPVGQQEQPAQQKQDPGYLATGIPSAPSVSCSQPPSNPSIPATATATATATALSPPRQAPSTSADKPAATLRHSHFQPEAAAKAAPVAVAAVVPPATERSPTSRASAKKGNSDGGSASCDSNSGGDVGGGGGSNHSSSGGDGGDRSGGTNPSSEAAGESSRTGAERTAAQGGDVGLDLPGVGDGDGCDCDASVFPRMLERNAPDFSFSRSRFDADPSKEGTGRRALGQLLAPDVLCYTLEVSFYASMREGVGLVPYTRTGYVDLGR
eukprot:g9612.t1